MKTEAEQIAGLVAALQSVPSPVDYPDMPTFFEAWLVWINERTIALMNAEASFEFNRARAKPAIAALEASRPELTAEPAE